VQAQTSPIFGISKSRQPRTSPVRRPQLQSINSIMGHYPPIRCPESLHAIHFAIVPQDLTVQAQTSLNFRISKSWQCRISPGGRPQRQLINAVMGHSPPIQCLESHHTIHFAIATQDLAVQS
jgi:hypothetical protein